MFEYFMPNLLLPVEPNSLVYESLAFCLYEPAQAGAAHGDAVGISNPAFMPSTPA